MVFLPVMHRAGRRVTPLALGALLLPAALPLSTPCAAQGASSPARERRVEIIRDGDRTITWTSDDDTRAVLGVSLGASSRRDTLGVLVSGVDRDGPAARAGIDEGARLAAINGVSLKLSADDAEDPALRGLAERRLRRELGKVTPGAEVELRVWADGQVRTVRVKTVSAAELTGAPVRRAREEADQRAFLGLGVGASGGPRDTLGLFVSSLTADGPAEKAGLVEGDRIRAINGVDVRVPPEDAGDWMAATARSSRFTRELRKVKPGEAVRLEVLSGGRARTVTVTAGKASDFQREGTGFRMRIGDGGMVEFGPGALEGTLAPLPPMPARPPVPPDVPEAPFGFSLRRVPDGDGVTFEGQFDRLRFERDLRALEGRVLQALPRIEWRGDGPTGRVIARRSAQRISL
jgi:membrane-associated protease RseP (regulator of RpoE activity)